MEEKIEEIWNISKASIAWITERMRNQLTLRVFLQESDQKERKDGWKFEFILAEVG